MATTDAEDVTVTKTDVLIEQRDASFKQKPDSTDKNSGIMGRLFPTGFKFEFVELIKYSWPIVLAQFFSSFVRITMVIFAGHLGKMQLDGATMAVSFLNLIGSSINVGLSAACDTFFSQSFGSPNKLQVGVYLQTALYVSFLCCLVSSAALVNVRNVMLHLGQDPRISIYTEEYVLIYLPTLFSSSVYQLTGRYLIIQGIMLPSVLSGLLTTILNCVLQYVLTFASTMGLAGSSAAVDIAIFIRAVVVVLFIYVSKVYTKTWSGWSKSSLQEWGKFMKFSFFSIIMISIEWWTFEISFFLMGLLGTVEIGASSILYQIWSFYASFTKGMGAACAYRVGRYLGACNVKGALTASRVAIIVAYMVSIFWAVLTLALRYPLPMVFANDKDVLALARNMLPILAVFCFFGSTKDICAGVVRGLGKQTVGGLVILVAFGLIAMPVGVSLMFYTPAGAAGFWWGLNIGLAVASICLIVIVLRVDWQVEVDNALERAKVMRQKKSAVSTRPDGLVKDAENKGHVKDVKESYGSIELVAMETVTRSPAYWRRLVAKRVITVLLCFAIFAFGFLCRFVLFIPPALGNATNTTYSNATFMNFTSHEIYTTLPEL